MWTSIPFWGPIDADRSVLTLPIWIRHPAGNTLKFAHNKCHKIRGHGWCRLELMLCSGACLLLGGCGHVEEHCLIWICRNRDIPLRLLTELRLTRRRACFRRLFSDVTSGERDTRRDKTRWIFLALRAILGWQCAEKPDREYVEF